MIINTGGRTDMPQYYGEWLMRRFDEGFAYVRNPLFPKKVVRYELNPRVVDCVVFCSKNYAPMMADLPAITQRFNTYFFYTITAYGSDMEPRVPSIDESIETLRRLSALVGPERLVWRYDPVLLSDAYPLERHAETFDRIAAAVSPHVSRCVFSFIEFYRKLQGSVRDVLPLTAEQMDQVAEQLGAIAQRRGLRLGTCATQRDYTRFGIERAGCVTLPEVGRANNVVFRSHRHRGTRTNCGCIEMRDIGAYDTCPNGCRYCYANVDHAAAVRNWRAHDPASPLLFGRLEDDDELVPGAQSSFAMAQQQQSLFD